MIKFQVERWREFYKDARHIFPKHWEDLALDRDTIKLSVDEAKYEQMDDMDKHSQCCLRSGMFRVLVRGCCLVSWRWAGRCAAAGYVA